MEPSKELILSPLCQKITRDGVTFELFIVKTEGSDWSLELVDAQGASIVWDGVFPTDQAAFDDYEKTVSEEGIHAVLGSHENSGDM